MRKQFFIVKDRFFKLTSSNFYDVYTHSSLFEFDYCLWLTYFCRSFFCPFVKGQQTVITFNLHNISKSIYIIPMYLIVKEAWMSFIISLNGICCSKTDTNHTQALILY